LDEAVVIAQILRPRANRGEVLAKSLTDVPGRLEALQQGTVRLVKGDDVAVILEQAWRHSSDWVLKFAGVDSIDAAERFKGGDLWIPREQRGQLPEGQYFQSDLLGCTVRDETADADVGSVVGFEQYGGPLLLDVRIGVRDVLIPFVPDICVKVDIEAKVIRVIPPEGLMSL
jgi:16S rRNA processing protein RimM